MFTSRDIRGVYGKDVTDESFFRLGKALSKTNSFLLVGKDPRASSMRLSSALLSGFENEKLFVGTAPTPAVAFLSKGLGACVTASHNPSKFNGCKLFKGKEFFSSKELNELKERFASFSAEKGRISSRRATNDLSSYVEVLPFFGNGIFDLRNGSACALKKVFPKTINSIPDPFLELVAPEPLDQFLSFSKEISLKQKKVVFVFDYDADRLVVLNRGKTVSSNVIACFFAVNFLKKNDSIVLTTDLSREAKEFLENKGFKVHFSKMGQVEVIKRMKEVSASFAAEYSGHFSFAKHMHYSDAVYVSAMLSKFSSAELADFSSGFKTLYFKGSVGFPVDFTALKDTIQGKALELNELDGLRAFFDDFGVFVHRSVSEPSLTRIAVDADSKEKLEKGKRFLLELLEKAKAKKPKPN